MAQNISVPDIGDFKDVEVIEVLVKPGDQINKNDPIVTIESDKSSVEIPSPAAGEIKDLKVKIGDKVSEGSLLATIENGQTASAPKEKKIVKEVQTQEKSKTNGEVNQVRQVKKIFAEPASKDDIDPVETNEWIDSLNSVIENDGSSRASYLLNKVIDQAYKSGLVLPDTRTTPYINTIPPEAEIKSPGDQNIEKKIRAYVRWNAAAMVVKANKKSPELGGHIGTFASAATLYDVGMNHFWRAKNNKFGGDLIYFQGHSAPGMYARAFLEGRLTSKQLDGFRQEVNKGGLSSYPHPWLMPKFWQFPTVSMGLGPIMAIYQARFLKYLINRGLVQDEGRKIWVFLGDGEMDEPESLGAIGLAAREKLDNLIFVVNCNLQRLDGPVRGNSKIIQELEGSFRGSGWNVIKVIWGSYWDQLLAKDKTGLLIKRMNECVDGEYQAFKAKGGAYVREKFFGKYPELTELVSSLTDKDIWRLNRGGHDPHKVYAAYSAAMRNTGSPTVILAKTIKGYGMGKTGESVNTTHQQKKLDEEDLLYYRDRFKVPLTDKQVKNIEYYKPDENSEEIKYLKEKRMKLGGFIPERSSFAKQIKAPPKDIFDAFMKSTGEKEMSTTMALVRMMTALLRDKNVAPRLVPIIPDEARTFGMEGFFQKIGIYAHEGQKYEPVDSEQLSSYREDKSGQVLEEGINESGAMSSWIAAGTAYTNHDIEMIPVYIFYSMFGFQRIGDMAWLAGDSRCKGFLLGATAGRTTLAGEGLQHQDGHGHVMALTIPNMMAYDPAFAYELAAIIKDGIRRMYVENEQLFYYVTLMNDNYVQAAMPQGSEEGILKGIYKFRENKKAQAQILGSGAILPEAIKASELLEETYGVATNIWSVTSYKCLIEDVQDAEREQIRNGKDVKPYFASCLEGETGPAIAASDYLKLMPGVLAQHAPNGLVSLGTDGFGRSDDRPALREHFEVDAHAIAWTVLASLAAKGEYDEDRLKSARSELGIDLNKPNPLGE